MRCSIYSATTLLLWGQQHNRFTTKAFSPNTYPLDGLRFSSLSSYLADSAEAAEGAATTKSSRPMPLSPQEIRAKAGLPAEDEDPPKLFEESVYDDIRQILLTLEKRANEGPGSLSMLEVEEFDVISRRVLVEMKQFEANRISGKVLHPREAARKAAEEARRQEEASQQAPVTATSAPAILVEAIQVEEQSTKVDSETVEQGEIQLLRNKEVKDISNDEGPEFDGGYGVPGGTRNTYVIPGMDEMSAEEYQKTLQQTIIDQQSERKKTGLYGNRVTNDYLNFLSKPNQKGVNF